MRSLTQAFFLAMRDYRHEALLSACSVLGLAAVLAPLMVLLGVHHGIISAMTERLLNDPRTLEVTPVGSGKYGPDWFKDLDALPETAFVIPQTRSIAATMNLRNPERPGRQTVTPLTASDAGDPLLTRWNAAHTGWKNDGTASVVLSESTARKIGASAGSILEGRLDRVRGAKRESAGLSLAVLAVLPPEAHGTDMMYVPLELLVASEDYRDGLAVPFLGWTGDAPGGEKGLADTLDAYAGQVRQERVYASFRLYASSLDGVSPLWRWFQERNVEVYVKAAEIESVKSLDRAFTVVFGLITLAAVFGFCASTASSALAGVRRKSRSLGIMRLIGFPRGGILLFPVSQTMATGFFGFLLALALYLVVAFSIDRLFAASVPGGESVCTMPFSYGIAVCLVVLGLSSASSLAAAWKATTIEPSEVIRDV